MTGTTQSRSSARYRGCLVGSAVGDALGAPMEGRTLVTQAYLDRLESDPGPLRYTDDTAMTIAVAESLTVRGLFDGADMAATLAARYALEPWRGYGDGPPEVFGNLERGVAWNQAATSLFGGSGSFGNGAAMRVAPVALFGHPDTDQVAELARNSAVITHTHPEGIDGAVAQAVAIDHVLGLPLGVEPDPAAMIERVRRYVTTTKFHHKLETVEAIVSTGDHRRLPVLGSGITAHASVPTALACFLLHLGSFPAAVKTAISLGGDTDTIAAMTGALVGAHLGLSAIPEQWRAVEGADQIVDLADALATHRPD
ncbi:MAG: ADP-ribosylglycohydrolase family protein [Acidimicrobiia bacterium]